MTGRIAGRHREHGKTHLARAVVLAVCLTYALLLSPFVGAQSPVECGPMNEHHNIVKHKGQHPMPTPSPGKALVYVAQGAHFGKSYQHKLAMNGRWVAVLKKSQYSFFETDPGALRFCWGGGGKAWLYLIITARSDQTYYLRGTLGELLELEPGQAKALIEKLNYVTFEVRRAKHDR